MDLIITLGIFVILLALGFFVGGMTERRHFADLMQREEATRGFLATQSKYFLGTPEAGHTPTMIVKEVIIASDYLKTFLANLRNIFGGEVYSFESLLERARREALLRIIEEAEASGYNAICNLRMDTAEIGGNLNKRGAAMASILASATAYRTVVGAKAV
jgi:uncharacterized protein YbjQ (UPF0145 family)